MVGELCTRSWSGLVADVWQVRCEPNALGEYVSPDPRLFVALDVRGRGGFNLLGETEARVACSSISYVPADMTLRSRADGPSYIRHLDLHFDVKALQRRFGAWLDYEKLSEPRLVFKDDRLFDICRLIALECLNAEPLHGLYGDGLVTALVARLFGRTERKARQRAHLTSQLKRAAIAFIEENCHQPFRLGEVAALSGLSESHFSHAFKASVGVSPQYWHQEARIQRAQLLLLAGDLSLTEIAASVGFSDQAHFTRVFRRLVGSTPGRWQRERTSE